MTLRKPLVVVAGQVQEVPAGDSVDVGGGNSVSKFVIVGLLALLTGNSRWYPDRNVTLSSVYFSLGTAPLGSAIIDVLKNDASIFSGPLPTCTAGNNKSSTIAVSVAMTPSDYLTVNVTLASGSDAVVCVIYS